MRRFWPVKTTMRMFFKQNSQFALIKENVRRGALL